MSNCIRLRRPDQPFGVIHFRQDVYDRILAYDRSKNCWSTPQDDPLRWLDVFCCDGGEIRRGRKPDTIEFYISFTTNREMSWFRRSIVELGGWLLPFTAGDEYDGYRSTVQWPHHLTKWEKRD